MKFTIVLASLLALPMSARAATLPDAEILHVLHTANTGEIAEGKLAKAQATSKDVQAFADQMVTEHQKMDKEGDDLAKKLALAPKDNTTSQALRDGAEKTQANLKPLKGAEFDRAYIDAQVKDHQTVLADIDELLLPSATDAQLKKLLQDARPKVAAHLQHAKKLQASLGAAH